MFYEIFIFILGIHIGSFLNVCIYRIPRDKSITYPPSYCQKCGYSLKILDLVPILSFIFLRGRCRVCREKISLRYPFVEFLTGIIYLLLYDKYGLGIVFYSYVFLMSILIIVFFIDYDYMIIPNSLVILGLVGVVPIVITHFREPIFIYESYLSPLWGGLIGSGFLLFVILIGMFFYKEEVMGMGDVKIFFLIGIFLGFKMTIVALALSIFIGGLFGIGLIFLGKKNRKSTIAFGPFIVMATFITLIFGKDIFDIWYHFVFGI